MVSKATAIAATLGVLVSVPVCAANTDVDRFIAKREQCDHFRGEEPYDKARAKFLAREMKRYCKGSDRALQRLKRKYAGNAAIMAALEQYDPAIE